MDKERDKYLDYLLKAETYKKEKPKIKNKRQKSGYLDFLCPTLTDKVLFNSAYGVLYEDDEEEQEYLNDELEKYYKFSAAYVGLYIKNIVVDLADLARRAFLLMLENMRMKSTQVEQQTSHYEPSAISDKEYIGNFEAGKANKKVNAKDNEKAKKSPEIDFSYAKWWEQEQQNESNKARERGEKIAREAEISASMEDGSGFDSGNYTWEESESIWNNDNNDPSDQKGGPCMD